MRPHIRDFIGICASSFKLAEPVVEIGAKRHPGQDKLANLRTLFPERLFIGCDMEDGPGVDRIENLEKLTFETGEVGTFVLCDTLEHVRDLAGAMRELKRCLDPEHGVLIATSVMLFPVHGFPNDYWRFTPEGFRELAADFPWAATFYGGDPDFPHSVVFVACCRPPDQSALARLSEAAAQQRTPVPHYADRKSEAMFARLGALLYQQARAAGPVELPACGAFGTLSREGWVLSPGTWIKAPLPSGTLTGRLEIRVGAQCIQQVAHADWNCLLEAGPAGVTETAFQFDPTEDAPEGVVQLELWLHGSDAPGGELLARSRPGVILPHAEMARGFTLHALDQRRPSIRQEERAMQLVQTLHSRGESVVLDLGCGFRKAGTIGIDATAENTDADLICLLGFDLLPFDDASVDEVVCRDFLEHIPKAVYLESQARLHYPVLQLMDEIWRVLRPGGVFRSWTPMYPHPEVFQDPTHLSAWTIKSMDYFCGIYAGAKRIYKIQSCFEKVAVREEGFYLYAELRKPQ